MPRVERRGTPPDLIVGVGASAGGLEAFKRLLQALPDQTGMAFLLVQHLDPTHRSMLAELLAPATAMTVKDADHALALAADHVYVIRPDSSLAVRDGSIELTTPTLHRGVRLPVDHLFRSLARQYHSRAVGIVLSGAGSDGTAGLREIKVAGGLTIAQDPRTSSQTGMPQSAIDASVADLVLEIDDVPQALVRFANLPTEVLDKPVEIEKKSERLQRLSQDELNRLAALLEAQRGFDLNVYKPGTVERRVLRRMGLSGFEDIHQYLEHLRAAENEQRRLIRDLLISVTSFFRNASVFATLRDTVIDPMVANAEAGSTLRIWVPGCATGEEAYSLAMEFLDSIAVAKKRLKLQVFATDIDEEALVLAREGVYSASISEQISKSRLQSWFRLLEGKGFQVRGKLRDVVSFAIHDLTKNPPFSRMDLVSCRNVLIYLRPEAQKYVLQLLHFALNPRGTLLLGTSESVSAQHELFAAVLKKHCIFRKVGDSRPLAVHRVSPQAKQGDRANLPCPRGNTDGSKNSNHDLARRCVLKALVPATIIVAENGKITFTHGELRPYLRIPEGDDPGLELSNLESHRLVTRTRGAMYKCRKENNRVVTSARTEDDRRVKITAAPAPDLSDGTVILTFEDEVLDQEFTESAAPVSPTQETVIDQLEQELGTTKEDLRNTMEELETSNEELRSSNEESMSMNEELQSTNEELEATTEELRALNEELTTVNAQLREKVGQLEQAHDDLNNFLSSTKIATLFLDDRLCIKRFTPAAKELLGVHHGDLGRRTKDIARELLLNDLEREAKDVLEHLSPHSRELRTRDGNWFARSILPYRTESRRIEGVVVTFVDVTEIKSATERLAIGERQQRVIARISMHALKEANVQGFLDNVVRDVQQTLDTDFCKILELQHGSGTLLLRAGRGWNRKLIGTALVSTGVESQAGYTLQAGEPVTVDDLNTENRFSGPKLLRDHDVVSGISCVIRYGDQVYGVLGAHTKHRRRFTPGETNFLQAVASVVGSALGRYQTRTRLAVELSVAQALAEAVNREEGLSRSLKAMASELAGSVAEIWWPDDRGEQLSCGQLYVQRGSDRQHVRERFSKRTFVPGEGLVGQVFRDSKSASCSDLSDPAQFVRIEEAKALDLVSGLGLPIYAGRDLLAVLTVFTPERLFTHELFLRSLDSIGRSIGDFLARTQFEQRARRLATITESSHDAILSYDYNGKVTEWLAGAERLFGYTAGEMLGSSIHKIVPEDRRDQLWSSNERIRRGEIVEPFETTRRRKDGPLVEVSVRSSPVLDEDNNVIGISSTDRDIQRLKETERKLVEADRQKDDFLAMLGHELRNPLAAMRSATELLRPDGEGRSELDQTRQMLERQCAHMAKLLDGLLDVSRIIRGRIQLETRTMDLTEVCRDVWSDASVRCRDRALKLHADLPEHPVWVEGDRTRLSQIFDNLLSNAVKYTEDGGLVSVTLSAKNQEAVLSVRDTGVGIEQALVPYVFEVFRQAEQNLDRAGGGLGLGLALVRSLVELHGGRVEASSAGKGLGAEFVVRLPLAKAPARSPASRRPQQAGARSVLVIEDHEDSAQALARLLELSSHDVRVAPDGRKGIDIAKQSKPDVVICDVGLPEGVSGYDVARELRSDSDTSDILLIALTGYGRPEDREQCLQAGFDSYMTKPVDIKELKRLCSENKQTGSRHHPGDGGSANSQAAK